MRTKPTTKQQKSNKKQFATLVHAEELLRIGSDASAMRLPVLGIHSTVMNNFQSKLFANPSSVQRLCVFVCGFTEFFCHISDTMAYGVPK